MLQECNKRLHNLEVLSENYLLWSTIFISHEKIFMIFYALRHLIQIIYSTGRHKLSFEIYDQIQT
jgi:hypothetical protein